MKKVHMYLSYFLNIFPQFWNQMTLELCLSSLYGHTFEKKIILFIWLMIPFTYQMR